MPLDPMFVDPMLGTFRNMMAEVDGKGLTGPDVDEMRAQLDNMEQLAQQTDDVAAFSGQLAQQNSFQKFSDAYSRVLSAAAKPSGSGAGGEMTDAEMLANSLSAYEQALQTYQSGQAGAGGYAMVPYVQRIIELGRSGVSYPVFLRALEEQGLNRALQGTAPAAREALVQGVWHAQASWMPYRIGETQALLAAYDELMQVAAFGQPDPLEFALRRRAIEWDYQPMHARYDALVDRWQYMITMLVDWLDAHCKFAPSDDRWVSKGGSYRQTLHNIKRTKECSPGRFRFREAVFQRYFHIDWDGIWNDDSFSWEYTGNRIEYSDARLHLVRATYPHCVPGGAPPAELIARAEELYATRADLNPQRNQPPAPGSPMRQFVLNPAG